MGKFIAKLHHLVWATVITAALSACGGGGGAEVVPTDKSSSTISSSTALSSSVTLSSSAISSSKKSSSVNSSLASSPAPLSSSLASSSSVASSSSLAPSSSSLSSALAVASSQASLSSVNSSAGAAITAMTIHYKRAAADYSGWALHLWGSAIAPTLVTVWATPRAFDGIVNGWNTAVIPITNPAVLFNFIVHKGDAKSPTADISFIPNNFGSEVWVIQDNDTPYFTLAEAEAAVANIGNASANLDLSTVTPTTTTSSLPVGWNKSAGFIEIFVRSYKDSDGDGKGDLQGLISKLDYLQSLGVTGIWLMPIMKSNDRDHGYGVVDYRKIEADYGTMADFDQLISEAHNRGIGIILDYVMNHSSHANPLFLDAATASNNVKRDWFIFSATNPGWQAWGPAWHLGATGYYYGAFGPSLPDFNLKNQAVIDYHLNNLRFWLNRGVDGFRFDAVGVLTENGSGAWNNQASNHPILLQAQNVINSYSNRYMVCEAPDAPAAYAVASSCVNAFAFGYQDDVISTATTSTLQSSLATLLNSATKATMPLILSNHDEFAGDRPIASLSGNSLGDYKVAAAITLLTSSTPFAYYGEEVGMANGAQDDDTALRTPMSWTANTTNGGFSSATPYRTLSSNVATFNVAAQDTPATSLLNHYRALFNVRKSYPILGTGTLSLKSSSGNSHLIFTRTEGSNVGAVLINLSRSAQNLTVNVGINNAGFIQRLPATATVHTSNGSGSITLNVPAQSAVVLIK